MLAQERYKYIFDVLQSKNTVRVSSLSSALKVSSETIRRDLEYLEKEGQLIRVHGGASLVRFNTMQESFPSRLSERTEQKEEIANIALKYVSEGQSIALDHSTTSLIFARELKKYFKSLIIVTNSLEILNVMADVPTYTIIFCGGIFNINERSCFGSYTKRIVEELNIDTAFIGVGGISLKEGCTETFFEGAEMLQTFLKVAQQKIILVDSSKFDNVTLIKVCHLDDIDIVITDSQIKKKVLDKYQNFVEIITNDNISVNS